MGVEVAVVQRQASPAGEHEVVSRSTINSLLEQRGHGRGDRDGPSGSRCLWMPRGGDPASCVRLQLPGEPTRDLGRVILTIALPRLVHPNRAAVTIDVSDPQCADLTEPQSRPGRRGQPVPMSLGQPYGGLQLARGDLNRAPPPLVRPNSQPPTSRSRRRNRACRRRSGAR